MDKVREQVEAEAAQNANTSSSDKV